MNTALWILQGLLAVAFLGAGGIKLARPRESLRPKMPYVEDFTDGQIKLIGLAEVLGALGLVLPGALQIAPILTPIAAIGLTLIMFGAIATHLRRKESPTPPAILAVLLLLVAAGQLL